MNNPNKSLKKLIRRLRSGKYEQAKGALRVGAKKDRCFCVEGLMCDIFYEETGEGEWVKSEVFELTQKNEYEFRLPSMPYSSQSAPKEVIEYFGIPQNIPWSRPWEKVQHMYRLQTLNDTEGLTFKEFADLLEPYAQYE